MRKEVFTTGEAAKVCQLSQQTIIRCFDKGDLKGFRVPGSRFRRIPRDNLIAFMKAYDIPLDPLQETCRRVLALCDSPQKRFGLPVDFCKSWICCTDAFSAGIAFAQLRGRCSLIVLDDERCRSPARLLKGLIAMSPEWNHHVVLATRFNANRRQRLHNSICRQLAVHDFQLELVHTKQVTVEFITERMSVDCM